VHTLVAGGIGFQAQPLGNSTDHDFHRLLSNDATSGDLGVGETGRHEAQRLELIIGEVVDEFDRDQAYVTDLAPGRWVVDGRLPVEDAVELGLRTLVRLQKQAEIKKYRGKLKWEGDLDDMRNA
jgi:hypothetical protein